MDWEGRRESENVEDRRSLSGRQIAVGGGAGALILGLVIFFLNGGDLGQLFNQIQQQPQGGGPQVPQKINPAEEELRKFVAVVLADTELVWNDLFRKMGKRYREPKLVLFRGQVESQCGYASAAVGPFYCPADEKVYLDLSFFEELKTKFKAPGNFAQAYVIAHEIGHHVQKLQGTTEKVHRSGLSKRDQNRLSVRLELQADFLAGVWAFHAQKSLNILEPGDLEAALRAAKAIGDDRLQMESKGYVVPDSFTHGSSEQRIRWFRKGFETGDLSLGDTFSLRDDEL